MLDFFLFLTTAHFLRKTRTVDLLLHFSQTVKQVRKLILEGPDSTKVESEVQMYLLALKNSMLPEAIPIFTKYAESEVGAYSTIALTALQRYDVSLMTDEV